MSMTLEEARIELQAMKDTFEEYEPGGSRCQMALNVALSALRPVSREQVEKVCRGEWNNINSAVLKPGVSWVCRCAKCGCPQDYKHNFCPNCGAAQTDEAVEMVMEKINNMEEMTNEH